MVIRFGDFELDEGRFELRRNGEVVAVQRRVLETILYLALRAGRLVTREELAGGPWGGTVVGDAAIARAIKEARAALGDTGEAPSTIVTVRGVGFRFEADVSEPSGGGASVRKAHPSARTFVGRERELSELELAWSEAQAGRGNLVLVVGAPGIGKSTLVERFVQSANARSAEVHFGRCFEAQGTPPYWPWPELLRSYTERHGSTLVRAIAEGDLPELASIAPALSSRIGSPSSEVAEGPYSAFRALDAVARFFRRAAERRPLALVLEDVHEAEGAALDLLTHLQRSLWDSKLLIVATCRSAEGRERKQLRALLDGELAHSHTIEVSGLNRSEVSRWFDSAGGATDAHELSDRVARATDGHPLLIANLIRALPSDFGAADLEQALARSLFIPENLSTSIRAELEALDSDALELVRIASVLGEEPWLPVLGDLVQSSPSELGPALDRALRAGVLERRDSGRLRFTHALIRELLYRDLSAERRLSLHGAAAVALSARLEDHPELVVEAAHHAMAASPCVKVDETVELLLKAAGWARRRLAFGLAAEHLGWALQTLDLGAPAPRKRAELLLEFARSLQLAGRAEEAVRAYHELYELSDANDFEDHRAYALVGDFEVRPEQAMIDAAFQERLRRVLRSSRASDWHRARLLAVRAAATLFTESEADRTGWLADAVKLGRASLDPSAQLTVLYAASRAFLQADAEEGLRLADEFVRLASNLQALERLVEASVWRASCLIELGRGQAFIDEVLALENHARRIGHPQLSFYPQLLLGTCAFLRGALEEAEGRARDAYRVGEALLGSATAHGILACQLAALGFEHEFARREALFRDALLQGEATLVGAPSFEGLLVVVARLRLMLGEPEAATALLERLGGPGFPNTPPTDRNFLHVTVSLVAMACVLRHSAAASKLRETLGTHVTKHVTVSFGAVYGGPVAFWLGRLDLLLGELEATEHFELAIVEAERACSRSWKAWAELGLAEALSKSESSEDLERARSLRDGVRRVASELELPRLLSVAEGRVAF